MNNSLELNVYNKNIVCYSKNSKKDSINIIKYSLKNNSKETYFINNLTELQSLSKKAVYNNGINLNIYDNKNIEVMYENKRLFHEFIDNQICLENMFNNFIENKSKLGYKLKYFGLYERNNIFLIHPGETIYFTSTINLNKPINSDEVRMGFVSLDTNKKYYSRLSIASDSSNYKNVLPVDVLKTIEENKVKVYHGIIESKNTVPVKVIE